MSLTANQIRAIEAENLVNNGLCIMKTAIHTLNIQDDALLNTMERWINSAQDWRDGK